MNQKSKKNQPHLELAFLDEAVQTVIDCHQILKNTYIFGYYMKTNNDNSLYTHHQEILRREADQLHDLLEMNYLPDIIKIIIFEDFNKAFIEYKNKIITIMAAILKFKENILVDIENHPDYIDYNMFKNENSKSKKRL